MEIRTRPAGLTMPCVVCSEQRWADDQNSGKQGPERKGFFQNSIILGGWACKHGNIKNDVDYTGMCSRINT